MLKNNIEVNVKVKCIETETTQAKLAEDLGTTPSDVNQLIKKEQEYRQQDIHSDVGIPRMRH